MKTAVLKLLDSLFGPIAVHVTEFVKPVRTPAKEVNNAVLIIRPGGIGDAVLLIPVINVLKKNLPDAVIDVLAEKRNHAVFSLCPAVNRVYNYDSISAFYKTIRKSYQVVIDTEQWHRFSAVVARLMNASVRIGFGTNERKKMFTHSVAHSHDAYEVDGFMNLLTPLQIRPDAIITAPFLSVPHCASERVVALLNPSDRQTVSIFPGGSIRERRWGSRKFHEVARMLSDRGYGITAVGGREDAPGGAEIIAGLPHAANFCGKLSLPETAAVLEKSALIVSGDSGILHLAYGLGVKTLSLFGPGIEKKWAPRGKNHIAINKNLECSPCTKFGYTIRCRKNAECMRLITVEEVFKKAIQLLEG